MQTAGQGVRLLTLGCGLQVLKTIDERISQYAQVSTLVTLRALSLTYVHGMRP